MACSESLLNKSHIHRFTENEQENKSITLVDNASVDLLVCSDPLLRKKNCQKNNSVSIKVLS